MEGKLTVYFDDPFWVGVYERQDESGYSVARVVLGSEPLDGEVYAFLLQHYDEFRFGPLQQSSMIEAKAKNYKRVQREVRRTMQEDSIGTKAQQAIKLAQNEAKQARKKRSSAEKKQEAQVRFAERQEKHKEKHRGH